MSAIMQELPVLKLRALLATLSRLGFSIESQRGSHIKLKKRTGSGAFVVIVPAHAEIRRGTLLSIIKQAGLTREAFLKLLEK